MLFEFEEKSDKDDRKHNNLKFGIRAILKRISRDWKDALNRGTIRTKKYL
jgi:hypothetical protein